jgi:hypothetical protein
MAAALKRVNLMLDEPLLDRLRREARAQRLSMSEMARRLLARDLGLVRDARSTVARIRDLRRRIGPMPDSTATIRKSRDRGW